MYDPLTRSFELAYKAKHKTIHASIDRRYLAVFFVHQPEKETALYVFA
ncbi:Hypothetical protein AKI40_2987 [Enterobacter sp. FY-07]|nr:Hypothetical protein AKI40_2987 [Enterobacter sp. FY-07]